MEEKTIDSSNINSLWLQNIYENLKKIEEHERYAREGCSSILEYVQMPLQTRPLIIADLQYKNLRLMFNEMQLVIPDLAPVIKSEDLKELTDRFEKIKDYVNNRRLLISEQYSESRRMIMSSSTTEQFIIVLDTLSLLRREIILKIKDILFIKSEQPTW